MQTTSRWRARIDPNTQLRFESRNGEWTARVSARGLYVDREGAWTDRTLPLATTLDSVRITQLDGAYAAQLEATRPTDGRVAWDRGAWVLAAEPAVLVAWIDRIELAIARFAPEDEVVHCHISGSRSHCDDLGLHGDEAKLYILRVDHGAEPLGSWQLHSSASGWSPPLHGYKLVDVLQHGRDERVGWRWVDVANVEVENLSGPKMLGAIVGIAALVGAGAEVGAPLALAGGGLRFGNGGPGAGASVHQGVPSMGGGGSGSDAAETWTPELAALPDLAARPLFASGARVRAIVLPTVALDTTLATRGDVISSGLSGRVRLGGVVEIGGGVRSEETRDVTGWRHATTGDFQLGLHLPLDAGGRVAIPVGFEVGGGGDIALDLRFPWGLRYTCASGRWFATAAPATPSYLQVRGEPSRWSLLTGGEVGATF